MSTASKPLTGGKVFAMIATGFAIIIAVNLTLAFQAVATFPGLETKNSYVASQKFQAERAAQLALNWDVVAQMDDRTLTLSITRDARPVQARIVSATLGRATHTGADQTPELVYNGVTYTAPITGGDGNWNLRLVAEAADGTLFRQRIIVNTP